MYDSGGLDLPNVKDLNPVYCRWKQTMSQKSMAVVMWRTLH